MDEQTFALAPRWALLIDPSAAQAVIETISKLALPHRVCRPLDRKREQIENAELAKFDAAIDATVEVEVEVEEEFENDAELDASSERELDDAESAQSGNYNANAA